jgi:hypothetical protein
MEMMFMELLLSVLYLLVDLPEPILIIPIVI